MRRAWRALPIALLLAFLAVGLGVIVAAAYVHLVPYPIAQLAPEHSTSLVLTDRNGEVLRTLPLATGGRAQWMPLERMPPELIDATLAGEDRRFFRHHGVDVLGVVRAALLACRHGRIVSGASTITMQLARMVEPHRKSLPGKLWEMVQALRIERALGKRDILEQYLNRAYYANGAFGIQAASQRYFGKSATSLGPGEALLLAVLPRAPRSYDPLLHLDAALARRRHVMDLLAEHGMLPDEKRDRIEHEPVVFAAQQPTHFADHFVDFVLTRLGPQVPGGTIRTTLDATLQRRMEAAVGRHVRERRSAGLAEAGVVVLDPATGAIRAMVGSANYQGAVDGQNNIVTTLRHPGSTLKPFVYALAIEDGESPASTVEDSLAAVAAYRPRKQMHEHGSARYREALAGSFNLAAVEVLDGVGVPSLLERLRNLGLSPLAGTSEDYGLDLALGSARVRLLDLAAAYGFLVSNGRVHRLTALADQPPQLAEGSISPEASWLVMDMLSDPGARRSVFGAELALDLPFKVAAKTGTSSGFADTLTVAATNEAVAAAWAGAFDGSGTRGTLAMWSAAPLVRAAMLAVADLAGHPLTLPAAPASISTRDVCRIGGELAGPHCPHKREHFVRGREPRTACSGKHGSSTQTPGGR